MWLCSGVDTTVHWTQGRTNQWFQPIPLCSKWTSTKNGTRRISGRYKTEDWHKLWPLLDTERPFHVATCYSENAPRLKHRWNEDWKMWYLYYILALSNTIHSTIWYYEYYIILLSIWYDIFLAFTVYVTIPDSIKNSTESNGCDKGLAACSDTPWRMKER